MGLQPPCGTVRERAAGRADKAYRDLGYELYFGRIKGAIHDGIIRDPVRFIVQDIYPVTYMLFHQRYANGGEVVREYPILKI